MRNSFKIFALYIPIFFFLIGIILQIIIGDFPLNSLKFPINFMIFLLYILTIIILYIFFRNKQVIKFLSSAYSAISSISLFIFNVLIMIFVTQNEQSIDSLEIIGFNKITSTWTYAISTVYLLTSLSFVTLRRLFPINTRNIFFYINHFGLWLAIASASLGQADKLKITITVPEGEIAWYGYDYNNKYHETNFAIKLNKFNIDYYSPKVAIIKDDGNFYAANEFQPIEIETNKKFVFKDYKIKVLDIIEDGIYVRDSIIFVNGLSDKSFVAKLKVTSKHDIDTTIFIQNELSFHPAKISRIDKNINFYLLSAESKYFGSEIELITSDETKNKKHLIEVNKPLKIKNWTIYQTSYLKNPDGRYISFFSAVYDPWINIVYVGIALMLIGALYLIFSRRKILE